MTSRHCLHEGIEASLKFYSLQVYCMQTLFGFTEHFDEENVSKQMTPEIVPLHFVHFLRELRLLLIDDSARYATLFFIDDKTNKLTYLGNYLTGGRYTAVRQYSIKARITWPECQWMDSDSFRWATQSVNS